MIAACAALPRDVAVERLTAAGAPVTPVLTPEEMGAHPHFRERGVIAVDDDGELRVCFPAVFAEQPGAAARDRIPSPTPTATRGANRRDRDHGGRDGRRNDRCSTRSTSSSRDMDAAVAFYRRLGVDIPDSRCRSGIRTTGRPNVGDGGLDFDLDSVVFARQWDEGWRGRDGAGCVVGFRVASREEVDAIYADLTGAGYRGQQPPYDAFWGARYAVIEDPDGNAVGLMSPIDPATATRRRRRRRSASRATSAAACPGAARARRRRPARPRG